MIIFPLRRTWPFVWTKLHPLLQPLHLAKFDWNWPKEKLVLETKIKKFRQWFFFIFSYYLPLEEGVFVFITITDSLHPSILLAKFGWYWLGGFGKKFVFLILSMHFCFFLLIFPWKRSFTFIWTFLYHQRMLCAKFSCNWPGGSGKGNENVNSLQQRRQQRWRTADNFWSEKLTQTFGWGEL